MGGGGVLLVGRAVGDVAVDDDQRGPVGRVLEHAEGALQHVEVVGVAHPRHVPAIAEKAHRHVVTEGERGMSLDRDVVVVVDPAQVRQLEMPGEGGGFVRDALHHAAVAAEGVDVVVEHREVGPVQVLAEPSARDRHAHARGEALAERARGGLDARGPAVLGVARTLRVELAEALDVVQRDGRCPEPLVLRIDRLDAGQVQKRVEQHRRVPRGEHEAVAIGPDRILGIEAQKALPQAVGDGRHRHRRPRMPRIGLLNRVHGQRPHRIDSELIELRISHCAPFPAVTMST